MDINQYGDYKKLAHDIINATKDGNFDGVNFSKMLSDLLECTDSTNDDDEFEFDPFEDLEDFKEVDPFALQLNKILWRLRSYN